MTEHTTNMQLQQTYMARGWRTGATFCKPSNGRASSARVRAGLFVRIVTFILKG